jgi:hypothetical protein
MQAQKNHNNSNHTREMGWDGAAIVAQWWCSLAITLTSSIDGMSRSMMLVDVSASLGQLMLVTCENTA